MGGREADGDIQTANGWAGKKRNMGRGKCWWGEREKLTDRRGQKEREAERQDERRGTEWWWGRRGATGAEGATGSSGAGQNTQYPAFAKGPC